MKGKIFRGLVIIPRLGRPLKSNYAYVVMQLENDELSVAIYAVEGLINQHTSENVLEKLLYTLKDQYEKEK